MIVLIKKKVDKKIQGKEAKFYPQSQYKAYTSVTVREPNEHNCDRIILNVSVSPHLILIRKDNLSLIQRLCLLPPTRTNKEIGYI